jgi:hypothetical protein
MSSHLTRGRENFDPWVVYSLPRRHGKLPSFCSCPPAIPAFLVVVAAFGCESSSHHKNSLPKSWSNDNCRSGNVVTMVESIEPFHLAPAAAAAAAAADTISVADENGDNKNTKT